MFNRECITGARPLLVLDGPNPLYLENGDTFNEPGYNALDPEDGDITANVVVTNLPDTSVNGVYTVKYTVTDSDGNPHTVFRRVDVTECCAGTVSDNPPVINLEGDNPLTIPVDNGFAPTITLLDGSPIDVNEGQPFVDPGFTASDSEDGDISADVVVIGTVDTNVPGTYTITYSVTDSHGNDTLVNRIVNVIAVAMDQPPVITLAGDNPLNLTQGETYSDPGASANDPEDGDITGNISVSGAVNTNVPGTYTVTYTVIDSGGNLQSASRDVIVAAALAPTLTLLGDNPLTINQGDTYNEAGFTATSNNGNGDITGSVIVSGFIDTNTPGTYSVTYEVTDQGQTTTVVRTVNVSGIPQINLNGLPQNVTTPVGVPYLELPGTITATDAEDGPLAVNTSGAWDTNTVGTYTVTYTATDNDNNTTTLVRTIDVVPIDTLVVNSTSGNVIVTDIVEDNVDQLIATDYISGSGVNGNPPFVGFYELYVDHPADTVEIGYTGTNYATLQAFNINTQQWQTLANLSNSTYPISQVWLAGGQYSVDDSHVQMRLLVNANPGTFPPPDFNDQFTITYTDGSPNDGVLEIEDASNDMTLSTLTDSGVTANITGFTGTILEMGSVVSGSDVDGETPPFTAVRLHPDGAEAMQINMVQVGGGAGYLFVQAFDAQVQQFVDLGLWVSNTTFVSPQVPAGNFTAAVAATLGNEVDGSLLLRFAISSDQVTHPAPQSQYQISITTN